MGHKLLAAGGLPARLLKDSALYDCQMVERMHAHAMHLHSWPRFFLGRRESPVQQQHSQYVLSSHAPAMADTADMRPHVHLSHKGHACLIDYAYEQRCWQRCPDDLDTHVCIWCEACMPWVLWFNHARSGI